MIYTEEELKAYLEYLKKLYFMVIQVFQPELQVEGKQQSPDAVIQKASENIIISSGTTQIFQYLMIPFNEWIYIDCPLTGHKGRPTSTISVYGSSDNRKVGQQEGD